MLRSVFIIVLVTILPVSNVYAYLDPGSGGMLLQLLFGGVAGAIAITKLYWDQIKTKICGRKKQSEDKNEELKEKHQNDI